MFQLDHCHHQALTTAIDRSAMYAVLLRPRLFIDGNQWCCLYGKNLAEGVAGFGDTPELAMWDFEKAMGTPLPAAPQKEGDDAE